jgi:hypothetical protein
MRGRDWDEVELICPTRLRKNDSKQERKVMINVKHHALHSLYDDAA